MAELTIPDMHLRPVLELVRDCLYVRNQNDLSRIIERLAQMLNVNDSCTCAVLREKGGGANLTPSCEHGLPMGWTSQYVNREFAVKDSGCTWQQVLQRSINLNIVETAELLRRAICYDSTNDGVFVSSYLSCQQEPNLRSLGNSNVCLRQEADALIEYVLPHLQGAWLKLTPETQSVSSVPRLTAREFETIKWAQEGKTVWEMSEIISISERTVKFHLHNIYQKLKVSNRCQAVAKALRLGLI